MVMEQNIIIKAVYSFWWGRKGSYYSSSIFYYPYSSPSPSPSLISYFSPPSSLPISILLPLSISPSLSLYPALKTFQGNSHHFHCRLRRLSRRVESRVYLFRRSPSRCMNLIYNSSWDFKVFLLLWIIFMYLEFGSYIICRLWWNDMQVSRRYFTLYPKQLKPFWKMSRSGFVLIFLSFYPKFLEK